MRWWNVDVRLKQGAKKKHKKSLLSVSVVRKRLLSLDIMTLNGYKP